MSEIYLKDTLKSVMENAYMASLLSGTHLEKVAEWFMVSSCIVSFPNCLYRRMKGRFFYGINPSFTIYSCNIPYT